MLYMAFLNKIKNNELTLPLKLKILNNYFISYKICTYVIQIYLFHFSSTRLSFKSCHRGCDLVTY